MNRGTRFHGRSHRGRGWRGNSSRGSRDQLFNRKAYVPQQQRRIRSDDPGKRLSEPCLAITEYVNDLPGFSGIIKARYSDFHVNEIDEDGNITKLTENKVPPMPEEDSVPMDEDCDESNPNQFNTKILPLETWQKLEELTKQKTSPEVIKVDATDMSKEDRTNIHNAVKQRFGSAIVGSTLNEDEKKYIIFKKHSYLAKMDNRVKWLWPGQWVHFLMHKENLDTMQAAIELSNLLHIRPANVTYAGTKDRRAKTTQWFSVKKIQPSRLMNASRNARVAISIGNFTFKDAPLKLGQLKGNRFRIALRNVIGENDVINKALESLKENGFINYYGLQRFGSSIEIPTYRIGLALLQGNWNEAVELILKPREDENDYQMREAREDWWKNRDAKSALSCLRKNCMSIEAKLLIGLSACAKNDYVTALEKIPRNMRLLYLHAYQSFIWNSMVSRRIREWGLKLCKGDLVLLDEDNEEVVEDLVDLVEEEENGNSSKNETKVNDDSEKNEDDNVKTAEEKLDNEDNSNTDKSSKQRLNVKILTQNDIDSGNYTIFDIVMPLPGYDVTYPENEISDWYKEILAKDDLSSETMKNRVKTYSLSGTYRKILAKPKNMSWSMINYNQPEDTLIVSDIEELYGKKPKVAEDGKYKALIIDFCLKSSTYATMALREVLKGDTSSENQAKLNNYHEKSNELDAIKDDTDVKVEKVIDQDNDSNLVKRELEEGVEEKEAKKIRVE